MRAPLLSSLVLVSAVSLAQCRAQESRTLQDSVLRVEQRLARLDE